MCLCAWRFVIAPGSAFRCASLSLPPRHPFPLSGSWRVHIPPLPILLGGSSNRTQDRRGLKKPPLLPGQLLYAHRLVPCFCPRTGFSMAWVIQMAPVLFRMPSPANFILKSLTSPQSFVSGARLLRAVLSQLILAFPSSEGAGIAPVFMAEASLCLTPKGKQRTMERQACWCRGRLRGFIRSLCGHQFSHVSAED